jgi:CcmD family protein
MKFLFAAYAATWIIHTFYMGTLARRFNRLRNQIKEIAQKKPR